LGGLVATGAGEPLAVRAEGDAENPVRVVFNLSEELARLDLVHADSAIGAGGCDLCAIRAKRDRKDDVLGFNQVAHRLAAAGLREPELGNAEDARVSARRGHPLAIGAVGDVVDTLGQASHSAVERAVGRLPERDLMITRCRDRRAVTAEFEGGYRDSDR